MNNHTIQSYKHSITTKVLREPVIVCLALAIFALIFYQSTVLSLYDLWVASDGEKYKHGLILLGIAGYFFYRHWQKTGNTLSLQPSLIGLILLFFTSFAWFLAQVGNVLVLQQTLFIFILLFLLWAILGYTNMRRLAFPILLLLCAIPVLEVIIHVEWLQKTTAVVVTDMLEATGFTTYREDLLIHVPAGTFHVAEDCAGMRKLIVAVSIAVIYAGLNQFRWFTTLLYAVLTAVFAFFINILRIYIVVLAGQLTDMQHYFIRVEHNTLGWVLFGFLMFVFIFISDRYLSTRHGAKADSSKARVADTMFADSPRVSGRLSARVGITMALVGLTFGPALAHFTSRGEVPSAIVLAIPSQINEWQYQQSRTDNYRPHINSPDAINEGCYKDTGDAAVCSYVGYFWKEEQGKELISDLNRVYDGKQWQAVKTTQHYTVDINPSFEVRETLLRSTSGKEKLVWHWYYLADTWTSSSSWAKVLGIWAELTGQRGAAVLVVSTDNKEKLNESRAQLQRFLSQTLPILEHAIKNVTVKYESTNPA